MHQPELLSTDSFVAGEKPYKCGYCDYAAAQKTSLKYHLDRRHKGKPCLETLGQAAPPGSPPSLEADGENLPPSEAKPCVAPVRPGGPDGASDAQSEKLAVPGDVARRASPVDLKMEVKTEVKTERMKEEEEEQCDDPLDLSLKVSLCVPAAPQNATAPAACLFCAYKSIYPEVLVVHTRLLHKDKSDTARRSSSGSGLKRRRLTGCPPALRGKDVGPLEAYERRHPRRTKSPPRQPATRQEQSAAAPPAPAPAPAPPPPERSPRPPPLRDVAQDVKRPRHHKPAAAAPPPTQDSSRLSGASLPRRPGSGGRYLAERPAPQARPAPPAVGEERGHPAARGGARWHSDAARLCMPSHFGSLPQVDFGAPAGKRPKYMAAAAVPPGWEADAGERPGFRGAFVGGAGRLHIPGRVVKGPSQGSAPPAPLPDTFGPLRAAPSAIGGGVLESEWNMMNLLRSYPPNDLASFYHSASTNPSHGGLGDPRAGTC